MHTQECHDRTRLRQSGLLLDQWCEGDLEDPSATGRNGEQVGVLVDTFADKDHEWLLADADVMAEGRETATCGKERNRG
jgi:hypothetical protein